MDIRTPPTRREQVLADMVEFPFLVKDGIAERLSISTAPGRSVVQVCHDGCLLIHSKPFNADGTLSEPCKDFLLSSVQTVARHFASPIRIVWGPELSTHIRADGSILNNAPLRVHAIARGIGEMGDDAAGVDR